mmetsp:Transcript_47307/g.106662  ORF Transcript_47307/g.106662 Transcript_47307/m.106662 type:complete len:227 (-) Transcript_47307:1202-1882(-)
MPTRVVPILYYARLAPWVASSPPRMALSPLRWRCELRLLTSTTSPRNSPPPRNRHPPSPIPSRSSWRLTCWLRDSQRARPSRCSLPLPSSPSRMTTRPSLTSICPPKEACSSPQVSTLFRSTALPWGYMPSRTAPSTGKRSAGVSWSISTARAPSLPPMPPISGRGYVVASRVPRLPPRGKAARFAQRRVRLASRICAVILSRLSRCPKCVCWPRWLTPHSTMPRS